MTILKFDCGKRQMGVFSVEFSIVCLLYFFILFAIIEGSRLIYTYHSLSNVARDGIRYAAVRGDEAGEDPVRQLDAPVTVAQLKSYIKQRSNIDDVNVSTSWVDGDSLAPGQTISIDVSADFDAVTPFLPSITLTSNANSVIYY